MLKKILAILILVLISSNGFAENNEVYNSNLPNITRTWMKFADNIILSDRNTLDNYIRMHHCDSEKNYFENDIVLEKFRKQLKLELLSNKDKQPHIYKLVSPMIVTNYDFDNEKIILEPKSMFNNVTELELPYANIHNRCLRDRQNLFNKKYIVDLSGKINIQNIDLSLEKAKEIIPNMINDKYSENKMFFAIVTIDITGILNNTSKSVTFTGNILDIGYYLSSGKENKFGDYNFSKEEKVKEDFLKDLQFKTDK